MEIDLQLNPATMPWPQLRAGAQAAEEAGFGALWMVDHLAGRSMGGDTMLECFTTLGALAEATRSIPLGTLVVNVNNRAPGVVATAAVTLDHIADRPTFLGLGAGASPTSSFAAEQHAVGHEILPTLADRHARVVRQLDVLELLWTASGDDAPVADFARPGPARRPTVLLGVSSRPLATLAGARTGGVNVRWSGPDPVGLLDAASEAQARRPPSGAAASFLRTVWARWDPALLDPEHPERRSMAAARVDRLVLLAIDPISPDTIAAHAPSRGVLPDPARPPR